MPVTKVVEPFQFKQFAVEQDQCAMKVGTDGVLLGAWACTENVQKVLDVGTGSGVIAIMMAQRIPNAEVHAIEIEEAAYLQAAANMKDCEWCDRLQPIHQSIQDYAKLSQEEYDLIISNPPFFSGGTFSLDENRNNVRHTVKLPHGDLLSAARKLMSKEGKLCIILPFIEGLRIQEVAKTYRLYCSKITEVTSRPEQKAERLLMEFQKEACEDIIKEEMSIYHGAKGKKYSEAYIDMTKAFYLKM